MGRSPSGYRFSLVAVVVLCAVKTCVLGAADVPTGHLDSPIVFAQVPAGGDVESRCGQAGGMLRANYGDGGRIVRLDPGGDVRVLTKQFASACELDVSSDAERILFAAKQYPQDPWDIWEMRADGSGARQVTRNAGNCRSPAYQATLYTIVSTEPWYQIMFVSDLAGAMNEYGSGAAMSLYSCRLDGSGVRRLTMNLSDDMDPFLMDDGRVLLASWQRMDLRRGRWGRVALFGVNTDGTDYALFCGDQGRCVKHMPCVTTDGLVVFVEADRGGWDGAGQLASVTLRRNFHSYRQITHDQQWSYHSPSPLPDGSVLVSRRPAGKPVPRDQSKVQGPRSKVQGPKSKVQSPKSKVQSPKSVPNPQSSVVNRQSPIVAPLCSFPPSGDSLVGEYVHPGRARTSPLIWRLYGRNTSRPWDETYVSGQTLPTCPPAGAEQLTDDEKLTLVEWIDLGALWDGIPGPDEFSARADPGVQGENRRR